MDFVRAITFPFDDEEWLKKLGLTFLIALIPIAGAIALYGWMLEIIRRVKMNDPQPLPDWADFGEYLRKGFMLFLAMLIYSLPVALLSFLAYVPMMASNENNIGLMSILSIICSCVIILLGLAVSILMLVGIVRYADSDNFSDFFAFSDNFRMLKDNIGDFGMALLYLVGFSLLVGLVSGITFGLGTIVAIPLTATFSGHLYGQLARKLGTASSPMV